MAGSCKASRGRLLAWRAAPLQQVTDVYDRHGYAEEDRRIMSAVARHVLSLVEGTGTSNVISLR